MQTLVAAIPHYVDCSCQDNKMAVSKLTPRPTNRRLQHSRPPATVQKIHS
jgi:hypothetical protein